MTLTHSTLPALDKEVVDWIFADRAVSFATLAGTVWVVYDHLCTIDVEYELIWARKKWSTVQIMFLVNRYVGLGSLVFRSAVFVRHAVENTIELCSLLSILQGAFSGFTLFSMQCIMLFRISSLYVHQPNVKRFLIGALVLEVLLTVLIQLLSINSPSVPPHIPEGVEPCSKATYPPWYYWVFVPFTLYEVIMLVFVLRIALRYRRGLEAARHHSLVPGSLATVLLRDSILFPFILCLSGSMSSIGWALFDFSTTQFMLALLHCLPNILGPRLILNLREAYYQSFSEEYRQAFISERVNERRLDGTARLHSEEAIDLVETSRTRRLGSCS